MTPEEIKSMIENRISTSYINVTGDGKHFEAIVVSDAFEGKMPVDRHKLIYETLGDAMKEDIHALSLKTYTTQQWKNLNNRSN